MSVSSGALASFRQRALARLDAASRWWLPGFAAFLLAASGPASSASGGQPLPDAPAMTARAATGPDTVRFDHARHVSISCATCHNRGGRRALMESSVARDCQGCHHADSPTGRDCARCHTAAEMASARQVETLVALSVWAAPRTRTLGFRHDRHGALSCAGCHAESRTRALEKMCSSCHDTHHQAGRDCSSCHPSARETHTRMLHVTGCTTSGCHVRERTAAVTPVRTTCLLCHAEQTSHQPGRECAGCHLSRWPVAGNEGGR